MNDIEDQIRKQPLQSLPQDWKATILESACLEIGSETPTRRRRSPLALFFALVPKPVAFPLAAAWFLIALLKFSTPPGHPSAFATLMGATSSSSEIQPQEALNIRTMIWVAWHQESKAFDSEPTGQSTESGNDDSGAAPIILP